jgi:hypothetical protein
VALLRLPQDGFRSSTFAFLTKAIRDVTREHQDGGTILEVDVARHGLNLEDATVGAYPSQLDGRVRFAATMLRELLAIVRVNEGLE